MTDGSGLMKDPVRVRVSGPLARYAPGFVAEVVWKAERTYKQRSSQAAPVNGGLDAVCHAEL